MRLVNDLFDSWTGMDRLLHAVQWPIGYATTQYDQANNHIYLHYMDQDFHDKDQALSCRIGAAFRSNGHYPARTLECLVRQECFTPASRHPDAEQRPKAAFRTSKKLVIMPFVCSSKILPHV